MTKEKIQSFTLRISCANRTEMMAILYDIGIEYLDGALDAFERVNYDEFREELHKAKSVLKELMSSVNNETKTGRDFLSLYIFASKEITEGIINKDKAPVEHVKKMFVKMSETYNQLAKLDKSAPVMEHAETVYSGLTYNKNSMTESINDKDMNRGYLV